jgi:hypothetical protein
MFHARAGDLICVDNYRLTHGRDGYRDPDRVMLSIWGWSSAAISVPEGPLDIVRPLVPSAMPAGAARDAAARRTRGYGPVTTAAQ